MDERETVTATYQRLKRHRDAGEIDPGFTMIEILIVIVVLGILAAVVIFALGDITGKTAVASCQADGATVASAIAAFNAQNAGVTVTQTALLTRTTANEMNPYIQSWPSNLPHYGFWIGTGTIGVAGTLYVVTGSYVANNVYQIGDNGNVIAGLTGNAPNNAVVGGTTSLIPALIPYTSAVCAAATTLVS
jgi:general secretion pathway protein G